MVTYSILETGLTIEKAVADEKIIQLKKRVGDEMLMKAMYGIISTTTQFFNVKENISDVQAIQTAALIIESYPAETLTDLMLCLKRAKLGEYGPVYNSIDGRNIIEWFRKYLNQKYEYREQMLHNEKITYQQESNEILGKIGKEIIKEISTKEDKITVFKAGEEIELDNLKKMVTEASNDELIKMREVYTREVSLNFYNKFEKQLKIINDAIQLKNGN